MSDRPDVVTLVAFGASVILGGANSVAVSFSNEELPPFWGAALRFLAASTIFAAILVARPVPLPRGRALLGAILFGVLGFGAAYAFLYWGLQHVAPGLTQVLMALVPLLTLLFALAHGTERFRARALAGALLALAGVAVVFREQTGLNVPALGLLAILGGAACAAEAGVLMKRFPGAAPAAANAIGMGVGGALLLLLSVAAGESRRLPATLPTWTALAFLVFVGSVAVFFLYVFVLTRWTASGASYQFVLLPFVTLGISAWLTGETITVAYVAGGALVLAGVYVGALSGPRDARPLGRNR